MGKPSSFGRFRSAFSKIHLVDKCLIAFMFVLLGQSAYVLFVPLTAGSDAVHIDVVVRTSAAAIFGYFLSANFISHSSLSDRQSGGAQPPVQPYAGAAPGEEAPRSRVGFSADREPTATPTLGGAQPAPGEETSLTTANRLQILVATGIGLFSLVVLLFIRNFAAGMDVAHSGAAIATAAQLRDFVSGCVGFLIGCPTTKKEP